MSLVRQLAEFLGFLEIIVSAIAIALYLFIFFLLSRTRLLHTAFRTTARIFAIAVSLYLTFSISIVAVYHVHVYPPFDLSLMSILHQSQQSGSYSFWLALSFMTFERAIATYLARSYEEKFNSWRSQLYIIALYVVIDIVQNLCRVFFPTPTLIIVCFCNTFVNLAVMYFIRKQNKTRNNIERELSYRYQVKENLLVSSAMLPLTYITFVFTFSLFPIIYLMKKERDQEMRELYSGCVYFISAVFPFTYVLGLLHSAAFRKVMTSQGFLKHTREMFSMRDQYEETQHRQDQLWKVNK